LANDRLPPTYAEISPSGNGIKFIARASGEYGRKTARGEIYSRRRFFMTTVPALMRLCRSPIWP
jgi:primase-polymerase (primpol)-like protein